MSNTRGRNRRPTLEDVASAAGVSRALVSIIVRGAPGARQETRNRVLQIAADLGYRPDVRARQLAKTRTHLIGVVYLIESAFHADLIPPIYAAAEAADYEVVLSGKTSRRDERRAIDSLLGYRCDALLLLGSDLPEATIEQLAGELPIVIVSRRLVHGTEYADTIRTDDNAGMRLAVEHLAGLGHRAIAHLDGGPGIKGSDRRRGYRAAMTRLGLADHIQIFHGGQTSETGRAAGAELVRAADRPTAVVAYNDDSAWGLMRALHDASLSVPANVSVVGYDASTLWRLMPPALTTIKQDAETMARLSVHRAVARSSRHDPPDRDVVLPPSLVIGDTTTAPLIESLITAAPESETLQQATASR